MAQIIDINNGRGSTVGSFAFDESPAQLHGSRTATGFMLQLPFTITMASVVLGAPAPMVSDIKGVILAGPPNNKVEIGRLFCDSPYTAGYKHPNSSQQDREQTGHMIWLGSFADLAYYDKLRAGGPVQFIIRPEWRFYFAFEIKIGEAGYTAHTLPEWCRPTVGEISVGYPIEVWLRMLHSLGVAENVLVEIPLPGCPSPDWDGVWEGLRNARDAFEQGGSTGWKNCIMGVRLALERWQKIEKEDRGPGWKSPTVPEREARTKKQRFDNLRWHLLQAAHHSAHTGAEEWTRDDAVLLFSTLAALLSERKP